MVNELNSKEYHTKVVKMLSREGELLKSFSSVKEASEFVGCPSYQISKVCTGKQKTCRGYKWEY